MCNQLGLAANEEDAVRSDISTRRIVQNPVTSPIEVNFFFSCGDAEDESRQVRVFGSLRL